MIETGRPNIFDTAKYVLYKMGTTTTLKLQKLLYWANAYSMVWTGKPIFQEDFQAWSGGPVCPELERATRDKFSITIEDIKYGNINNLNDDQRETIDLILKYFGKKKPYTLTCLVKSEDPWILARHNVPAGYPSDKIITKKSMQRYYSIVGEGDDDAEESETN